MVKAVLIMDMPESCDMCDFADDTQPPRYGERTLYCNAPGIDDVTINSVWKSDDNKLCIYGSGFTPWTKIYVNGEKVSTSFLGSTMLKINLDDIEDGDTIVANIVGSSSTIFRSSNEFLYEDPDIEDTEEQTTETEQPSTDTEGSTQTTEKSTEQSSEQSLSGAGTATDQSVEHTVNTPLTQN